MTPEFLWRACAYVEHKARGIVAVRPFADIVERNVASYRISHRDIVYIRGKHSRLAHRGPIFQAGIYYRSLREYLAQRVVVKYGRLERVAHLRPVQRGLAVAVHRDGTDENEVSFVLLSQFLDRAQHGQGRAVVGANAFLGVRISHWRYECADSENIVHIPDALAQAFIVSEVAPHSLYLPIIRSKQLFVAVRFSCQHPDVKLAGVRGKLLERCKAHCSCHAGYKNLFLHVYAPFRKIAWSRPDCLLIN